jgi:hypothetical protein
VPRFGRGFLGRRPIPASPAAWDSFVVNTNNSYGQAALSASSALACTAVATNPLPPSVPDLSPAPQITGNPFIFYSFDLLSGALVGITPMRAVQFGQQLNTPGQAQFTLDLADPRVLVTNPIAATIPNRTLIVIAYQGVLIWGGIIMTRRWNPSASGASTTRTLQIQASELWCYFQQRVQATDYSAPPSSGITGTMSYWTATPWDAGLIAAQVISDAIAYSQSILNPYANLLGGLQILYNGVAPAGASPVIPSADYVAVTYPLTSTQTVDTIITQLSQLGLGVGYDFGVDLAWSSGSGSTPIGTINLAYPRRGRTVAQNSLMCDLSGARSYLFPEDGTQTANQVYEVGGSGAISVSTNVFPLEQGFPLWERVMSRASAQSQNIMGILGQTGLADLATYSYAPVAPTVTVGLFDQNIGLSNTGLPFIIGDDVRLFMPATDGDGGTFDTRFPTGLDEEWRIVGWQANLADEGDPTLELDLAQPPFLQAIAPAI